MKKNRVKKICKRIAALALVAASILTLSTGALAAGQELPNGIYALYSIDKVNGLNVWYAGGSGSQVVVDTIDGESNELWIIEGGLLGSYVTIRPYHQQKCYLSGVNGFDGNLTIRRSVPTDKYCQWKPISVGDGQYLFQNRATGYVIDCAYGHTGEIANRYLTYESNGFAEAQHIYPVRVSTLTMKLTPSGRVKNFAEGSYTLGLYWDKNQLVNIQYAAGVGGVAVCDPNNGEANETVIIKSRGNGLYSIHFAHQSNLCLAPSDIFPDSTMTLREYDGSRRCLWEIYQVKGGYSFRNAATCLMLDDFCGQTRTGAPQIAYSYNGDFAQVYEVKKAENKHVTTGPVSPVPAGCYFNKKTTDWDGRTIYHDINVNVNNNTPVYAMFDGTVEYRQCYKWKNGQKYLTSYGNCAELISHDGQWRVIYAHLSRFEDGSIVQEIPSSRSWKVSGSVNPKIILKTDNDVKAGETIGRIGTTGNSSGNHLHIEVYHNGVRVDPTTVVAGLTR